MHSSNRRPYSRLSKNCATIAKWHHRPASVDRSTGSDHNLLQVKRNVFQILLFNISCLISKTALGSTDRYCKPHTRLRCKKASISSSMQASGRTTVSIHPVISNRYVGFVIILRLNNNDDWKQMTMNEWSCPSIHISSVTLRQITTIEFCCMLIHVVNNSSLLLLTAFVVICL